MNASEKSEASELKHAVDVLRPMILRYEAVRTTPGAERAIAGFLLGRALARHGSPVVCDGWVYRWWREEQSISRMPATGRQRPRPRMAKEESLASVGDGPAIPG